MERQIHKQSEAGFTLLETIGAILVILILTVGLAHFLNKGTTEMRKQAVAQHLSRVTEAVTSYGRAHYKDLLDKATATKGPTITIADLIREEFLPTGFNDHNPWNQTYAIYAREPKAGELQLITLTTGGRSHTTRETDFGNIDVPSTAALAKAGFIPTGAQAGHSTGQLRGAYGAWVLELSSLGITAPAPGHLGSVSNLTSFEVGHDYLYRVEVPGHPELNEMWTELDMTDHAIEKVKEVQFVPHTLDEMENFCASEEQNGRFFLHEDEGLYICRDGKVQAVADTGNSLMIKEMTLASHGQRIAKPHCPSGVDSKPEIFVSPMALGAGYNGAPIAGMQSWATSVSDEQWQVNLRILTDDPTLGNQAWINPPAQYGQVMVLTLCSKGE